MTARTGFAAADLDLVFCAEGYAIDVHLRLEATDAELTDLMNSV
ncbi:hypothetical protein OG698_08410 [Streptomyces sp. NBC_01003]|nr:hypothetical protein OG698_08410 [Streptomyces sp. NBC_01003]